MKVTTRELGNREIELVIELDDGRVDSAMRTIARRYAREIKIPGFRPGRTPYTIVAQRVGQDRLLQDALEEIAPQIYEEAVEEAGIEPYELKPLGISSYDPLTLTATIPLVPKVELGDYHLIRIERPTVEVAEADIDEVLRAYQEENAQLVPVDRGAELDDQVIVDLEIEVDEMTVYNRENISFVLAPGGLTGVPEGFFQQLVEMRPGAERQFTLIYPDDFGDEELAGKVGNFNVVLHEVKERELPELDDELAQTVGEFDTLEELRERTREILLARAQIEADKELAETVMTRVMDMATVEYPAIALENEIDHLITDIEARLKDQGLTLDNYLIMEGLTRDQLREQQQPNAERRLKRGSVLSEVVEREGIEVSDAEIDEEIETIAGMYGARAAEARASLSSEESRRSLRSRLLAQKAINRLVELATRDEDDGTADLPSGESDVAGDAPVAASPKPIESES
ncbi:MAG: trigger factor [Anaerolineae bacterium]